MALGIVLSVTTPVMVTTFPFLELLDELLSTSELTEDELLIAATLLDEIMGAAELELMEVVLGESPPPPGCPGSRCLSSRLESSCRD